jgi:Ala-tRNA(Pro) deacylase
MMPDWITNDLDAQGVAYHVHHHRPEYTAQAVAKREHTPAGSFAKVVVVVADGAPVLLVLPAYARVDFARALTALSAREIRLARETEMQQFFPDVAVGTVPPLRHWPGVQIWMDNSLSTVDRMMFAAGTHEDAVHIDYDDWLRVARPRIADFIRPTMIGA